MGGASPFPASSLAAHPALFPILFPFFFAGLWLTVTTLLGFWSGWFKLQAEFPDSREPSDLRLHWQSGLIGFGALWNPWGKVSYSRCLRLDACPGGLRVAIWRLFGPFCRPFLLPWRGMEVESRRILLWRYVRLTAVDAGYSVTIRRPAYDRIRLAVPQSGLPALA